MSGFVWKDALVNVTPKTFIGCHRTGFRLFWHCKSRPGRPQIPNGMISCRISNTIYFQVDRQERIT